MPADVDFVPLVFHVAQRAFVHLAEITQGRRIADEAVNFLLGGHGGLDVGENQFQFLGDDAFEFEEMVFIRRSEFFAAGDADKMLELLPAFDVVLDLRNQHVQLFVGTHRRTPS